MYQRLWCYTCQGCMKSLSGRQLMNRVLLPGSNIATVYNTQCSFTSEATIPSPTFEGEQKTYAPKIQQLVTDISKLTLVEVADLNELLKKTLKISDVPVMAAPMAASKKFAEQEEDEPQVAQTKTAFTVRLMKFDDSKKVALIKEIKSLLPGMNLVQAKKIC